MSLPPFSFVFSSRLPTTADTHIITVCQLGTEGHCDAGAMFWLLGKTSILLKVQCSLLKLSSYSVKLGAIYNLYISLQI